MRETSSHQVSFEIFGRGPKTRTAAAVPGGSRDGYGDTLTQLGKGQPGARAVTWQVKGRLTL